MAVQFGLGILRLDSVTIGHLQGVTIDFSFDNATLFSGNKLFPADVRTHTGNITGNAEFANINARAITKLLGATQNLYGTITLDDTTAPIPFELLFNMETDNKTFRVLFNSVRSSKLSFAFSRENHVIPNFDFVCYSDTAGVVGTITLDDVS
jgi:hypothetical protein